MVPRGILDKYLQQYFKTQLVALFMLVISELAFNYSECFVQVILIPCVVSTEVDKKKLSKQS